ncbi:MAG: glycogen branching protein [Erysipelotrichia bacterium]|nr:glycogen branching protein [Erysipelotrichia bacterium]
MKIAYLMHSDRGYEELIETINQLTKQEDHVFVMINDNDLREKISFVYADGQKVHISHIQEFAQEGDLSLARGTIIQMKEALELGGFDYFINLSDAMLPVKTRNEIVAFLEANNNKDFYYVDRDKKKDHELRKKTCKYYSLTSLLAFPNNAFVRGSAKAIASLCNVLGIRRKLEDTIKIGSPWFIISKKSAINLVENYSYVSTTFKLSWYPEEMYIPMMMDKYVYKNNESERHINKDLRIIGPNGHWVESAGAKFVTQELIDANPDALFAAKITAEDTLPLYEKYFDKYNEDYKKHIQEEEKEKTFIDPSLLYDILEKNKEK